MTHRLPGRRSFRHRRGAHRTLAPCRPDGPQDMGARSGRSFDRRGCARSADMDDVAVRLVLVSAFGERETSA
jgi:hypothetical protein